MGVNPGRPAWVKVDRQLVGEPVAVGEHVIRPVTQVRGWYGARDDQTRGGGAALLRVVPVEVIVRDKDGTECRIPITDPTREVLRGMVTTAVLVAVVCCLLMLMIRRELRQG